MAQKYIKLLILLLFLSLKLYPQDSTFWMELMQPEIGQISNIKIDKAGNILLCSANGIFKSTDYGNSWNRIAFPQSQIAISSDNQYFIIATDKMNECHINKSTNTGKSWIKDNQPTCPCQYLIDFDKYDNLYLFNINSKDSIITYFSSDFGISWEVNRYNLQIPNDFVTYNIFVDSDGILYAGGITRSTENKDISLLIVSWNKGLSWKIVENLPQIKSIKQINNDSILFCTRKGLYYTSDKGKSFNTINKTDYFEDIVNLEKNELFAYKGDGNSFSTDFGNTWEKRGVDLKWGVGIICYDNKSNILYGTDYYRLFISADKGITWKQSNKGFSAANVKEMASDSKNNLYVIDLGIYKSTDEGITWYSLGLETYFFSNIAIDKEDRIYLSNYLPGKLGEEIIFRSTDGGITWEDKSKGLVWQSGIQVLVHDIFITKQGHILLGTPFDEYWESTDNGDSWSEREVEGSAHCFAYNSEGHLFRGGYDGIFYRSTDEGQTWEQMKKAGNYHSYEFYSMVFSPYSQVGFASGYSAIWNYSEPSCLKTTDNGRSWFNSDYCGCLAVDSLGHIWNSWSKTTDDGENWINYGYELPPQPANTLFVDHQGYIYLALKNSGIFRSRDRYVSVPETQEPPGSRDRLSASPNPFSDGTSIIYTLDAPGEVTISLYDMLGRQVADIYHGYRDEGRHSMQLLITNYELPINPGVYLLRLETQKEVLVSKVIIIK